MATRSRGESAIRAASGCVRARARARVWNFIFVSGFIRISTRNVKVRSLAVSQMYFEIYISVLIYYSRRLTNITVMKEKTIIFTIEKFGEVLHLEIFVHSTLYYNWKLKKRTSSISPFHSSYNLKNTKNLTQIPVFKLFPFFLTFLSLTMLNLRLNIQRVSNRIFDRKTLHTTLWSFLTKKKKMRKFSVRAHIFSSRAERYGLARLYLPQRFR